MCVCILLLIAFILFCFTIRDDPETVDLLVPPPASEAGDRVFVDGYLSRMSVERLNPKKKIWEKLQVRIASAWLLYILYEDY